MSDLSGPLYMIATQCVYCEHRTVADGIATCPAFPGEPVPEEIRSNRFDHRRPHPAQTGPQLLELRPRVPAGVRDALYRALDAAH